MRLDDLTAMCDVITRFFYGTLLMALLSGCSTWRPWQNAPLPAGHTAGGYRIDASQETPAPAEALTVVVTFSGGGARAAAFGYGVLQALEQQPFSWQGREISLLDEIDLISGVSGGSIAAAHYAAFGKKAFFRDFERDFLARDFQGTLVSSMLRPDVLNRLSSPRFGRSNVLMDRLDEVFRGLTYGDLARKGTGPYLLVTATDLSNGSAFEFTQEQFDLICSDLSSVPLSFAVASSSAVPLILTPLVLRNHASKCPLRADAMPNNTGTNYRARLLATRAATYLDDVQRPFIHLVDGGLSDNLGIRQLIESELARGRDADDHSMSRVQKFVIITVYAERSLAKQVDQSSAVPGAFDVLDALVHGAGSSRTTETLGLLADTVDQWRAEIGHSSAGNQDSRLGAEDVYFIPLSFESIGDSAETDALRAIPTSFSISKLHLDQVVRAARTALANSSEFRRLMADLDASARPGAPCCRPDEIPAADHVDKKRAK